MAPGVKTTIVRVACERADGTPQAHDDEQHAAHMATHERIRIKPWPAPHCTRPCLDNLQGYESIGGEKIARVRV